MNKKISVFLAIFILALFIYHGNYVSQAQSNDRTIVQLAQVLQQQEIDVDEWSLYAKEEVTSIQDEDDFYKKINELKRVFSGFNWELKREREVWKAVGLNVSGSITEKITFAYTPTKKMKHAYILYHVTGIGWSNDKWRSYEEMFQARYDKLFLSNPIIFSCIKGELDDKMESVLSLEIDHLLKAFHATPVESITEESFVSVSAYTELWENAISTKEQQMNLQIALRETGLGGQTTLVVGTPIITSEY
ncbi:YwmB family TATA-box binding protein [Bacillus sp. CGMCC 1.16541]|uniref:YwmB family TATA-box binding protein n=1 Tax=Bacillus sp. CGMCC 1.16541 TaxID=2185143 RepID=UPI000D725B46|nr:YwmB family TATA-box binding protein [Bacillus sp. CGMCC 1.16541]